MQFRRNRRQRTENTSKTQSILPETFSWPMKAIQPLNRKNKQQKINEASA